MAAAAKNSRGDGNEHNGTFFRSLYVVVLPPTYIVQ
jgi:hypothetical protein